MRRFTYKYIIVFIFILIFTLVGGKLKAEDNKFGGTLIFGQGAAVETLDPHITTSGFAANVIVNIYEGLVRFRSTSTRVEPALATSWETKDNGQIWTFKLRKGITFHDGSRFDADAVVFNFKRQIDSDHPYHQEDQFPYAGLTLGMIKRVEAVDKYRVRFVLNRPYAPFLKNLAMFPSHIISPQAIRRYGSNLGKHPVGTGPFFLENWNKGNTIVLKANKKYWKGRPYLDRLKFKVIRNSSARFQALKSGRIKLTQGLTPLHLEKARNSSRIKIMESPGLNLGYIALHNQKPPFNNKYVRQAVNYAVNKKRIAEDLLQGGAVPARGPLPESMWGYNQDLKGYPYDPLKAKQLLKKAGYEEGFNMILKTYVAPRPYNPVADELAQLIKEDLKKVGIDVQIKRLKWSEHLKQGMAGQHKAALFGWISDNGDPDNFLNVLFNSSNWGSTNRSFYHNAEVDRLLHEAQTTLGVLERQQLYQQIQKIIVEDAPVVFLNHMKYRAVSRERVKNFKLHPTGITYFQNVWLSNPE